MTGSPTTHAVGGPTRVQDSAPARRSSGTHSAAPASAADSTMPSPAPTGTWAAASTANDGAAALSSDPPTSSHRPSSNRSRMPSRVAISPIPAAVAPATSPETARNWPAVAVETSKSRAISASTGESAIRAACPTNMHANRIRWGAGAIPPARATRTGVTCIRRGRRYFHRDGQLADVSGPSVDAGEGGAQRPAGPSRRAMSSAERREPSRRR